MRLFPLVVILLISLPVGAQRQRALPIVRQSPSSTQLTQTTAPFAVTQNKGISYVTLQDLSSAFGGQLRWRSAAKAVDFSVQGHRIRFGWDSRYATMNGKRIRLDGPTMKREDGFWVPASFFASSTFFEVIGVRLVFGEKRQQVSEKRVVKGEGRQEKAAAVPAKNTNPSTVRPSPSASRSSRRAIRRIVIDPGHGGKDPGSVSPQGVLEKDINLKLALELADVLRRGSGYEVLLTRTDDSFIPLAQRAKIANQFNADLFISIHCNGSLSPKLKGFEVYFLSENASDPRADAVARTENAALALEEESAVPPEKLNALLRSLVRNANINESSAVGSLIDRHVSQRLSTPSLGVKQAGFYVLRGAEMPAVLVEAGFLTNPQEVKLLKDARYRARLAQGILAAVDAYDQRKQQERGSDPKI